MSEYPTKKRTVYKELKIRGWTKSGAKWLAKKIEAQDPQALAFYNRIIFKRWTTKQKPRSPRKVIPGYVYIFSLGYKNAYKIGVSTNPTKRLKYLQAGNPWIAEVAKQKYDNAIEVEFMLHKIFDSKRLEREIFILSDEDIQEAHDFLLLGNKADYHE